MLQVEVYRYNPDTDSAPKMQTFQVDTGGKGGILRIDFGEPEENLTRIDWDEFFRIFDDNGLEFLYQDKTAGGDTSRFNKFVSGK